MFYVSAQGMALSFYWRRLTYVNRNRQSMLATIYSSLDVNWGQGAIKKWQLLTSLVTKLALPAQSKTQRRFVFVSFFRPMRVAVWNTACTPSYRVRPLGCFIDFITRAVLTPVIAEHST